MGGPASWRRDGIAGAGGGSGALMPAGDWSTAPPFAALARYLAARRYRRTYGGRFVGAIHPNDELLQWGLGNDLVELGWSRGRRDRAAWSYYNAVRGYLAGGAWNALEVQTALHQSGVSLREAGSLLEFACGYGRVTRHFVQMISPSKLTVSDIDRAAVDFVSAELGVRGFYSTTIAEDLVHAGRYDVIVVISLFSHLSIEQWGPWLNRLSELLNPGGLLLLSTHNIADCDPADFEAKADGFLYREQNETLGRLSVDHYGAAFVSEKFVRDAVAKSFQGPVLTHLPHGLLLGQDLYVLQRSGSSG